MTIKQQFLLVHNDIIKTLDNRFVQYLDANLSIAFSGEYPQQYEGHLLTGTYNFQVKVNNIFYSPYSDEFFDLTSKTAEREYIVKYAFLHNYCFSLFCNYFEILSHSMSTETAKAYLSEYHFFLQTQIMTNNQEYKSSYKLYWREILLRVIYVLENGGHSFYDRFTPDQRIEIVTELTPLEESLK